MPLISHCLHIPAPSNQATKNRTILLSLHTRFTMALLPTTRKTATLAPAAITIVLGTLLLQYTLSWHVIRRIPTTSVAISEQAPFIYSAHCGQTVNIKNTGGRDNNYGTGKSITATVADTCPGCDPNDLDLSTSAFKALTSRQLDPSGEFNIQWHLN